MNNQEAKASQPNSKSMGRKSSRASSDEKEQHLGVLPELGEKLRLMNTPPQHSRKSSSSRRSHHRSSGSRSSHSNESKSSPSPSTISVRSRKSHSAHGRSRSSASSSPSNSDRNRRRRSSRPSQPSEPSSKVKDKNEQPPTSDIGSLSGHTLASDVSVQDNDSTPGAYRIGSLGRISIPTSPIPLSPTLNGQSDHTNSTARSSTSSTSAPNLTSVLEEHENRMVEAVVAQDVEQELEEARLRGRQEALSEVERQTVRGEIAVVMPVEEDDDDDDNNKEALEIETQNRKKRKRRRAVLFAFVLLIALAATAAILLFNGQQDTPAPLDVGNQDDSNAKVVIVYTPPTEEECDAIVNGTILEDQQSLIARSFDMQIDITLASENDFGALLSDMLRHIQEKLIPIMAGCGAIDYFDTTIALAEGLQDTTNSIANGQVEEESERSCDGNGNGNGNGDLNGNCRSYILVLDLYLNDEESSASLIQVIGNAVNGNELARSLGASYPVETASVPWILPSGSSIGVTATPTVSGLVTAVPTQSPNSDLAPSLTAPTLAPTIAESLAPGSTQRPTSKVVATADPTANRPPVVTDWDQSNLTDAPTRAPTPFPSRISIPGSSGGIPTEKPASSATRSPTLPPTRVPTKAPTRNPGPSGGSLIQTPTSNPTRNPTPSPSRTQAEAPTGNPTKNPTKSPTMAPNAVPTVAATLTPTKSPSESPTDKPSSTPSISTLAPTVSPTPAPTKAPTVSPTRRPTASPSRAPTPLPTTPPTPLPTPVPTPVPTPPPSPLPTKAPSAAPITAEPTGGPCCSADGQTCGGVAVLCTLTQLTCISCGQSWIFGQ